MNNKCPLGEAMNSQTPREQGYICNCGEVFPCPEARTTHAASCPKMVKTPLGEAMSREKMTKEEQRQQVIEKIAEIIARWHSENPPCRVCMRIAEQIVNIPEFCIKAERDKEMMRSRMEAKDTIMSRTEVNKLWKDIGLGSYIPEFADYSGTHPTYKLLHKQAEISFKAGQPEERKRILDILVEEYPAITTWKCWKEIKIEGE